MTENKSIYRRGNLIGVGTGTLAVLTEYTFQILSSYDLVVRDSWISGNIGDYGATLAMTCWHNRKEPESFLQRANTALFFSLYWTGFEFLQKGHLIPGTYDTKDILAYWLGSASALLLSQLFASERVNNLFQRINPSRRSRLEDICRE